MPSSPRAGSLERDLTSTARRNTVASDSAAHTLPTLEPRTVDNAYGPPPTVSYFCYVTTEPLVYRVPEAAHLLGVGRNEVRDLLHRGDLIGWRDGHSGYWRIPRQSIEGYVERRIAEAQAEREALRAALPLAERKRTRHPQKFNKGSTVAPPQR